VLVRVLAGRHLQEADVGVGDAVAAAHGRVNLGTVGPATWGQCYDHYYFFKLPPYTMTGPNLTTQILPSGDDTTRPRRQGMIIILGISRFSAKNCRFSVCKISLIDYVWAFSKRSKST
jgi:hypothetical protein